MDSEIPIYPLYILPMEVSIVNEYIPPKGVRSIIIGLIVLYENSAVVFELLQSNTINASPSDWRNSIVNMFPSIQAWTFTLVGECGLLVSGICFGTSLIGIVLFSALMLP